MSKVSSCELHQVELHETCRTEKMFQGRHTFVRLGKDQNALSLGVGKMSPTYGIKLEHLR